MGLTVVSACGADVTRGAPDEREEDAGDPTSGVAPERPADQLLVDERGQLCDWLAGSYADMFRANAAQTCTFFASGFTSSEGECRELTESCVDESRAAGEQAFAEDVDATECVASLGVCKATVAEIEACLYDELDTLGLAIASARCGAPLPEAVLAELERPSAACTVLQQKCAAESAGESDDEDEGWFLCNEGEPVEESVRVESVCDGDPDCTNGADEVGCPELPDCNAGEPGCMMEAPYTCGDGTTIPAGWACDGLPDCPEGEDEQSCV